MFPLRIFLLFATALLIAGFASVPALAKPNVIVILTDDQGWGDLSLNGNANLKTPRIDSLARDGAMFERFFVQPVCSPTRAEFLTGRYHPRGGVWNVSTGGERLNINEKTIADALKASGYVTACFGKWHNGSQYPYHPRGRGFDEYYGFTSGHWGDYFSPPLDHNGEIVKGDGYLADDLTNRTIGFIEKHKSGPFFAYLAYNTPHSPMQVPDHYFEPFKNAPLAQRYPGPQKEQIEHTRAALAMCENLDANIGRILKRLDELKLSNDTIVVFFSDNGPNGWRWNGGMKGRKGTTDEGGVRSPLLIRWPAAIKPGTVIEPIAGAIDLLSTILDCVGAKPVGEKPLDGLSLKPLLTGQKTNWADRRIFAHWNGKISVRTQRYRLDDQAKLFDLVADPGQTTNVAAKFPDIANELKTAVSKWRTEVVGDVRNDRRPFPIGYPEFPVTQLPARDGVPKGAVKRSAPAPNCSFFTNWKSTDDTITWNIEVVTAGKYAVDVWYTCPDDSVGTTIELKLGDRKLAGAIAKAHNPSLRGQENDRVSRGGESYVKDFQPMRLGTIELPKTTGLLTIQTTKMTGTTVMDLRGLTMTLQK